MFPLRTTFLSCLLLGAACGSGGAPATTPAATPVPTPAIEAKLAAADRVDGKEDHVVHKCAGCSLHMDGLPAHAMTIGAYQMHFCKAACLARYTKDPLGELGQLKVE